MTVCLPSFYSARRGGEKKSGFSVCSQRSLTVHCVITACQEGSDCRAAVARQRPINEPEIRSCEIRRCFSDYEL